MKKIIFFIAICMVGITSCIKNEGYEINANISDAANGSTVYLQKVIKKGRYINLENIDSTTVKEKKVYFKGGKINTTGCYIAYKGKSAKGLDRIYFYLENGNITIEKTDRKSSVTGTLNNDAYQPFRELSANLTQRGMDIRKSLKDKSLTKAERKVRTAELKKVSKQYKVLLESTMNNNLSNELGLEFFEKEYETMTFAKLQSTLNKIPTKFNNREVVLKAKETAKLKEPTAIGKQYVDFEMKTPNGKSIKISDCLKKNKYVLLDFWASWCGPCRKEMPNLKKIYSKYHKDGLEIIGISLDDKKAAWENAIEKLDLKWIHVSELMGKSGKCAVKYHVTRIPHLIIINKDGKIVSRGLRGDELDHKIEVLMGK